MAKRKAPPWRWACPPPRNVAIATAPIRVTSENFRKIEQPLKGGLTVFPLSRTLGLAAAAALIGLALMATPTLAQEQRRVTVMSYNVENLFDTEDNPAREGDNTYLPRSQKGTAEHIALCERNNDPGAHRDECLNLDWNDNVLAKKIANLAAVIGRFDGSGPDILVLQEVENQQILNRLRAALPGPDSYVTAINLDDSPGRGINVAILS